MTDKVIIIGGPVPGVPGSQARRCKGCTGTTYVTLETLRRVAIERPQDPVTVYCLDCVPDTEQLNFMPFNEQQVTDLHAVGFNLTADQINKLGPELLTNYIKRRR